MDDLENKFFESEQVLKVLESHKRLKITMIIYKSPKSVTFINRLRKLAVCGRRCVFYLIRLRGVDVVGVGNGSSRLGCCRVSGLVAVELIDLVGLIGVRLRVVRISDGAEIGTWVSADLNVPSVGFKWSGPAVALIGGGTAGKSTRRYFR